jgi:hypothetical protein
MTPFVVGYLGVLPKSSNGFILADVDRLDK